MENFPSQKRHRDQSRKAYNEEFLRRLYARRPQAKKEYDPLMAKAAARGFIEEAGIEGRIRRKKIRLSPATNRAIILETIVRKERPVLFVKKDWVDVDDATVIGPEAKDLVASLNARRDDIKPLIPLIGRIDAVNFPGSDFIGTGWFVDTDIVVTNRHVASLIARWDGRSFAFSRGVGGKRMTASVNTLHEFDDIAVDQTRAFAVTEVLYIESDDGPDIAFLRVARRTDGTKPYRIVVAKADVGADMRVFVVGYPARAPRDIIPDQVLMKELYRDRYDVKRVAPGFTIGTEEGATKHDCTTLGGNSGSVVLAFDTAEAVGLHFAGLYQETNYAVRAAVLSDYVNKQRWRRPPVGIEIARPPAQPKPPPPQRPTLARLAKDNGAVTLTLPLSITVKLGQPIDSALQVGIGRGGVIGAGPADPVDAEAAAKAFWSERPDGVIAVRVGFNDEHGVIGDKPFIAASVTGNLLDDVEARGPAAFRGFEVRYLPANVAEQIEAMVEIEAVDSIAYDDDARTGPGFSFAPVDEVMTVRAHVGPEYSWDELNKFLSDTRKTLVSAIYEFHASQIKDTIEARLKSGASLTLVMDNKTFSDTKDDEDDGDDPEEFEPISAFDRWKKRFKNRFDRIVAPEGRAGLISDAYHIKVTVRDDDTFWLSSGNWKRGSSQPVITQEMRDEAATKDLPGNREWHVVIRSKTLAGRFRNHIRQDFKRSKTLGAGPVPRSKEAADVFVDVPVEEEEVVLERRPPSRLLEPREFARSVKVKPLLTPDNRGAVYSNAVLALIGSAQDSLLFQIPYIGMRSNPNVDRGFIDELIDALTQKLRTLPDARVMLRVGGSKFSTPTHAAWFFKSRGIDIDERLRQIENHHTKGMIVDGRRVLLGSHNWSKSGVTLNRDASLILDDEEIAAYYAEAFEIDWQRSNPIAPRRFVKKKEAVVREAVGDAPPPGFRRVRLSDILKEDD
jgi:hypothetical protein